MKPTDFDQAGSPEPETATIDDIISDLFHDAQNGVHLVGMELELVSMGLGSTSDAAKTANIVKQMEQNLRDLRGYVSALQQPSATCDAAAILDSVIANLQSRKGDDQLQLTNLAVESLPGVQAHPKLLARIFERVFEFCEDLMRRGGEIVIRGDRRQLGGQWYAEIDFTIRGLVDVPSFAEEELTQTGGVKSRSRRGIERALEVLRRQRGQSIFRRHDHRTCQLTLRMLASPQ
jgi:hypothetical protein